MNNKETLVKTLYNYANNKADVLFAVDSYNNEFTYSQAWDKVETYAYGLKNNFGLMKNEKVMIECNQDVDFLVASFACELIGAIFIPIENDASDDRKAQILEDTKAEYYISKNGNLDNCNNIHFDDLKQNNKQLKDYSFPEMDDVSQILFTTGTTGKSKGIVISNRANVALAENIKYGVEMKEGNVEFIPVPISHSHGLRCCYANLLNGGTIVLIDGLLRVKKVFEMIEKYKVTAMDLSPSAANLLIKLSKGSFFEYAKKLDYIQIGTAVLPETLKEQLINELPGVRLYNFYGSTESGRSCAFEFSGGNDRPNCIGKPTINAEIVFVDENQKVFEASKDNPGLLASKGQMNMDCYYNNPKLTEEVLKDGYLYTKDLGYIENGYVYVLGRQDDVINFKGIKIAPSEIEEIATKYEGVIESVCIPLNDKVFGQVPKLLITVCDAGTFNMSDYHKYLNEHLDGNKIPKSVEIIDEIPKTFNGKIKRKDLIERYNEN